MIKLSEVELIRLSSYVKLNYGVNLSEKKFLIESRLGPILIKKGFATFTEYLNYILAEPSGEGVSELINKVTTNYTYFLREKEHYVFFKEVVFPYLLQKEKKSRDIRIWSAGCSTGEEPYSLAMIIADYFKDSKKDWDTKILATDISKNVLEKAMNGVYPNESLSSIPYSWRMNYFELIYDEGSRIKEHIKREIIFRRFNLMNERFPFKRKFHVIFCRNVMIYFQMHEKEKLVNQFYNQLEKGGYLFIGQSESLTFKHNFKYIMPSVYRKE